MSENGILHNPMILSPGNVSSFRVLHSMVKWAVATIRHVSRSNNR